MPVKHEAQHDGEDDHAGHHVFEGLVGPKPTVAWRWRVRLASGVSYDPGTGALTHPARVAAKRHSVSPKNGQVGDDENDDEGRHDANVEGIEARQRVMAT